MATLADDFAPWLAKAAPNVDRWEYLGDEQWRGTRDDEPDLRYLATTDGTRYVAARIDITFLPIGLDVGELERCTFSDMKANLVEAALPDCVVSGCGEKGTEILTATQHKHFAGKDWEPGDHLHLCLAHTSDVYRSPISFRDPKDLIAGWLRREWETNGAP